MTVTPDTAAAMPGEPKESDRVAKKTSRGQTSRGLGHELAELGMTVFYALLITFVLRVVLFQPFTIPSESMEPTLLRGDYIIVSKFAYGWSRFSIPLSPPLPPGRFLGRQPHRGDIIVFRLPREPRTDYIKRLIGLPGDRIQVVQGQLVLNGKPVERQPLSPGVEQPPYGPSFPVARFKQTLPSGKSFDIYSYGSNGPADNTGVYVVPKNCYFMMGDNRDNSSDSRFDPGDVPAGYPSCPWNPALDQFTGSDLGVGFVPYDNLIGRADIILFSWKPGVSLFLPWTWFTDARWGRFFNLLG